MTKSPVSMWGVKVGLCLPRRTLAIWTARRPTTSPVPSMCSHSGLAVAGVASVVLLGMAESARATLEGENQHLRVDPRAFKDGRITICPGPQEICMTATAVARPPLGLPPGSIRGLLALQVTI